MKMPCFFGNIFIPLDRVCKNKNKGKSLLEIKGFLFKNIPQIVILYSNSSGINRNMRKALYMYFNSSGVL
jgi:hypothetical protein